MFLEKLEGPVFWIVGVEDLPRHLFLYQEVEEQPSSFLWNWRELSFGFRWLGRELTCRGAGRLCPLWLGVRSLHSFQDSEATYQEVMELSLERSSPLLPRKSWGELSSFSFRAWGGRLLFLFQGWADLFVRRAPPFLWAYALFVFWRSRGDSQDLLPLPREKEVSSCRLRGKRSSLLSRYLGGACLFFIEMELFAVSLD